MIMYLLLGHTEIARNSGYVLAYSQSSYLAIVHPDNTSDNRAYRVQTKGEIRWQADAFVITP